ncbi:hypothetical protein [Rhodovarius sp.]|uniref:hypothetical protein n=1 Tax=Rhodovarius sp. TaxID=2972673 RepID=UPI0034A4B4FD
MRRRDEDRLGQRERRARMTQVAARLPLWPQLPLALRYMLGFGLLFLCLWLPAFATLFRR